MGHQEFIFAQKNNPISDAIVDYYLGRNFPDLIDFYYVLLLFFSTISIVPLCYKKTYVHTEQNKSQKW